LLDDVIEATHAQTQTLISQIMDTTEQFEVEIQLIRNVGIPRQTWKRPAGPVESEGEVMNPEMIEAGSKPRLEDTTGPKGSADMPEPIIAINLDDDRIREGDNVPTIAGDDDLIRKGEAAAERFSKSREAILPMARGLAAARRKYPANREFGDWLKRSAYSKIGEHDRSDLINIGKELDKHEDVIVKFLNDTDLVSPQTIWAAIRKKLQPRPTVDPSCYDNNSGDDPIDATMRMDRKVLKRLLKANGNNLKKIKLPDPPADDESTESKTVDARPAHERYGTDKRFDLVLLTPSKDDLKRLRADYASLDALAKCLPLREHVKESAAIVIPARISDLPVIADVLLPLAGFKRPTRVLLAQAPKSPDVTDAEVFITAERGIEFNAPEGWLDDAEPIEIAERLYRDASSTLHLFAHAKAKEAEAKESRRIIVGDDSWFKLPSVR
jgi:hypothetical protein